MLPLKIERGDQSVKMNGGKYVIRTIISGNVVEKSKFWVSGNAKVRGARTHTTSARKQDKNDQDAVKRLARWFNCNFGYGDLLVSLEYDKEGMERIGWNRAAAEKQLDLFLRRLKRAMKKEGLELRFAGAVTSDMDGRTGADARIHHHVVLPKEAAAFLYLWRLGSNYIRTLRKQDDYTAIAAYLLQQVRRIPDAKKYKCSRNLKKPLVYEREAKRAGAMRNPSGTLLMASSEYDIESGSHYIRYIKAPKPGETGLCTGETPVPQRRRGQRE